MLTKPRTVCACQPVRFMISSSVTPLGRFIRAMTSCFLFERSPLSAGFLVAAVFFTALAFFAPFGSFTGFGAGSVLAAWGDFMGLGAAFWTGFASWIVDVGIVFSPFWPAASAAVSTFITRFATQSKAILLDILDCCLFEQIEQIQFL